MKKIVLSNTCDNSSLEHSIFCIFLSPMLYTHTHTRQMLAKQFDSSVYLVQVI